MPRESKDPVKHIVTFRVNSEEKKILKELARQSGLSISDFMRRQFQAIKDEDHEGLNC
jgi:uncharacterized protein (DUF1778 family)